VSTDVRAMTSGAESVVARFEVEDAMYWPLMVNWEAVSERSDLMAAIRAV